MPRSPERRSRPTTRPDAALLAEWEAKLKAADPKLLSPSEEQAGVQFGAEGGEDVEFVDVDQDSKRITAIAQAIAREPGNELWKVPADLQELTHEVVILVADFRKNGYGEPKIGIHTSCVTGDPCVFVTLPDRHPQAGRTLHLPTVNIEQFYPVEFGEKLSVATNLEVRLKP